MLVLWTDAEIERLEQLANEKKLSASQIGAELGKTRNAIIGKAHRRGIKLGIGTERERRNDGTRACRPRRGRGVPAKRGRPPLQRSEPAIAAASNPVTLAQLDMVEHCRFPIGEPRSPEFRYCGAPRVDQAAEAACVYCAYHQYLSFTRR